MLSAMAGFTTAFFTGSLWLGVLAAVLTGVLVGALMGLLTVSLGLSQHVSRHRPDSALLGVVVFLLPADFRPAVQLAEDQAF